MTSQLTSFVDPLKIKRDKSKVIVSRKNSTMHYHTIHLWVHSKNTEGGGGRQSVTKTFLLFRKKTLLSGSKIRL